MAPTRRDLIAILNFAIMRFWLVSRGWCSVRLAIRITASY